MANVTAFSPQTAAAINSAAPNAVNKLFSSKLQRGCLATNDVFAAFEGPMGAKGVPIARIQDLTKSAGQTVHFTKHTGLGAKPILGESTLRGNEEKMSFGTHSVTIDFVRNASSTTRKQLRIMAAGGSVIKAIAEELAEWYGAIRKDFIMQRWIQRAVAGHNIFYPGNKGSINGLTSSDDMAPTVIDASSARLRGIGAKPISSRTVKSGAVIPQYMYFAPYDVLLPLKSDTSYLNRALNAENRGPTNSLETGEFCNWNGQTIFHWNVVDDDVDGPIGSFFNPKALLGGATQAGGSYAAAISAGTGVLTINGGGTRFSSSTTPTRDYFRYFPGNITFKQSEEESISSDTTVYYLKIFNVTGADAGKWGFYSYTGSASNNGNTLVTTERLGSGASGTRVTTLGSVTWDGAVNTDAHPQGSPMYWANSRGNVIGYVGALGSEASLIAYGGGAAGDPQSSFAGRTNYQPGMAKYDSVRFNDSDDYGMVVASNIEGVMGVDVVKDTVGNPRNYILIPTVYVPPEAVL